MPFSSRKRRFSFGMVLANKGHETNDKPSPQGEPMNTSQTAQENIILPFSNMMYPFMTLDDNAEIVHSEMGKDGRVKVYIEKPDAKDGFHRATCYLPSYTWEDIFGFSDEEIDRYKKVIESTAHLIMEFSQKGGFSNAANL